MSGGTNSNIRRQNTQIRRQYRYDRRLRRHTIDTNQDRYDVALQRTANARTQEREMRAYREQTADRAHHYQTSIQDQRTQAAQEAYDKSERTFQDQRQIYRESAAITRNSEVRRLEEAVIEAGFDREELNIGHLENTATATFDRRANTERLAAARGMNTIEKAGVDLERDKTRAKNAQDIARINALQDHQVRNNTTDIAKLNRDKTRIDKNRGWGLQSNTLQYNEAAAKNLAETIDNRAELIRTKGAMLARGVEGNTATALGQSALAEYGRKQSAQALSLIFAGQKKTIGESKLTDTATLDRADVDTKLALRRSLHTKETSVNAANKRKVEADSLYATRIASNKGSKLDRALRTTQEQISLSNARIASRTTVQGERHRIGGRQIDASTRSARREYTASINRLNVDHRNRNLQALGRRMIRPITPPPIPQPLRLPQTVFVDPSRPRRPPPAVRGAMGRTSVWNTVGDGLGVLASVASIAAPFVPSDIKTKHSVEPIENASTKLSNLKPVSFYYTPEYTAEPDRLHHGFVAQEYKEVMPDATYDLKGTLAIDTNDLIGLLVKGHQELQEKIVQLEKKLSATN